MGFAVTVLVTVGAGRALAAPVTVTVGPGFAAPPAFASPGSASESPLAPIPTPMNSATKAAVPWVNHALAREGLRGGSAGGTAAVE
ncbi:hypothetical protein ACIQM0_31065 [Streptomyces sp. NPDC091387]|uniref:hypothetical protein n=1 Tax=Streptomyces sp. NPDC091387 TaxID=3365998 RepID=UPI0037FF0901